MKVLFNLFSGTRQRNNGAAGPAGSTSASASAPSTSLFTDFGSIYGGRETIVERRSEKLRGATLNVVAVVGHDHRLLQRLLLRIRAEPENVGLKSEFCARVVQHLSAETVALQPAVTRYITMVDASRWASAIGREHIALTALVAKYRRSTGDARPTVWKELVRGVEKHIRDSEEITLDWLHRSCERQQLIELGERYEVAKEQLHVEESSTTTSTGADSEKEDE